MSEPSGSGDIIDQSAPSSASSNTDVTPSSASSNTDVQSDSTNVQSSSVPESGLSNVPLDISSSRPGNASTRPESPASPRGSRPGSASSQRGSRPGSASRIQPENIVPTPIEESSLPDSVLIEQENRPGSSSSQRDSRPGSPSKPPPESFVPIPVQVDGVLQRPSSASSQQGSRPGSVSSQREIGPRSTTEGRPGSGSSPGTASQQLGSRPSSAASQIGSRPGSASSQQGRYSPLVNLVSVSDKPGSRPSSASSQQSSTPMNMSDKEASRPESASSQSSSASSQHSIQSVPTEDPAIQAGTEIDNMVDERPGSGSKQRGSRPASAEGGQVSTRDPRRMSTATVLQMEMPENTEPQGRFVPLMEPFPSLPEVLSVIEEETEEVVPIEVVAAAMGNLGEDIETPRDEIDVPTLLEDVHSVPTILAQEEPPKALFEDKRIPSTVDAQLAIPDRNYYMTEFESEVKEDVLMIGNISLEEIQAEEQRLREEHVRYQSQEATLHASRQRQVLIQTELAKRQVLERARVREKELKRREKQVEGKKRLYHTEIQQAYRRAESQLMYAVKNRKAEIETMFGDLVLADAQYGGNKGRRWKVDWDMAPQPVQIKLHCFRGIKDKLPAGRYVALVSMYDRIGGHVMRWSNLTGQQWSGSTLPLRYDGAFHTVELDISQSVFTVCPSRPEMRPSMVFIFEIFLLRGPIIPTDRVVAWGAFPLCDKEFSVIEGKYKCPLLRGEIDNRIQSHDKVERLIATDIDNWLCNLYFEVIKLPRYMGGHKEFEVELQFSSALLGYPDRLHDSEEPKDGNRPVFEDDPDGMIAGYAPAGSEASTTEASKPFSLGNADKDDVGAAHLVRPFTAANEMMSDEEDEEDQGGENDYENEFEQVKDNPGLYYKVHREHPVEKYHSTLYKLLPRTTLMQPKKTAEVKKSSAEELGEYQFAIRLPFSEKGNRRKVTHERFQFLWLQFLTEVGTSKFRTPEFWTLIFFMIVSGLGRMLLHYSGQYLLLYWLAIPISSFTVYWYSCELSYPNDVLYSKDVIGLVIFGPLFNIMIFTMFVCVAAVSYRIAGYFPNMASQFIAAFGVMATFDWLIVLIIDVMCQRYKKDSTGVIGDAFKLWEVFERKENNGLVGVFLTIFIYIFLTFLSSAIFYMYYLRIHLNGRLLDIFGRLNGAPSDFFLPHDLEISHAELDFIITKCEQWRGEEGERRKTVIYDYIWEEEKISEEWEDTKSVESPKLDVTTHISIHTLHLDGLRELYRHFLRLGDGAILEVFGEAGYLGLDEAVKSQLCDKFDDMEVVVNTTLNRTATALPRTAKSGTFGQSSRSSSFNTMRRRLPPSRSRSSSRSSSRSRPSSISSRQM